MLKRGFPKFGLFFSKCPAGFHCRKRPSPTFANIWSHCPWALQSAAPVTYSVCSERLLIFVIISLFYISWCLMIFAQVWVLASLMLFFSLNLSPLFSVPIFFQYINLFHHMDNCIHSFCRGLAEVEVNPGDLYSWSHPV